MHARHRNQGNGYRSNTMGMGGIATASRISPDGSSMRGPGFYNSDYRNYNRGGFGRGKGRQFQPPQPPPRKGDIFMEAGKLAAEYLVSKGLLPPNALSGKWQNGCLKNQVGGFQSIRSQEGGGLPLSADDRSSALSRLGNSASDIGPGRRRYFDDYNSVGSRNFMGERSRSGSVKNPGTDWDRELGRSDSWSGRNRDSSDVEGHNDTSSHHKDEEQGDKEGAVLQNSPSSEDPQVSDNRNRTESPADRNKAINDGDSKKNAFSSDTDTKKISFPEADAQPTPELGIIEKSDTEAAELNDENSNDGNEKQTAKEDIAVDASVEENQEAKNSNELVKLCRFANVPTRTRSSIATKSAKIGQDPSSEGKNITETESPEQSIVSQQDVPVDGSSISRLSDPSHNLKDMDTHIQKLSAVEEEQDILYPSGQGNGINRMTIHEEPQMQEQGENGVSGFGSTNSMLMERGEKRALDLDDRWDAAKKPREWAPSIITRADGCLSLSNLSEKPRTLEETMTSNFGDRPDNKRLLDMTLFQEGNVASCVDYAEEKKAFPGSFKTCDLNLMEASEVNEHHDTEPIHVFPSTMGGGKQETAVGIDLTMSNNQDATDKYGKSGSHGNDIEVIDLENDSMQEDKAFNGSEPRAEAVFTDLDGFSSNANNSNEIPDVQDGYGLMISELLGNDIPNCSSVPPDMNSLHNDMGLHNGEGILGDDDSIYMTLGEIPISFLRVWEQPTQEYGKPF